MLCEEDPCVELHHYLLYGISHDSISSDVAEQNEALRDNGNGSEGSVLSMAGDQELRVEYLSVGLAAQRLIDVLIEFVEEGKNEELDPSLREALDWLKADEARAGAPEETGSRVFLTYEQVRTLSEVLPTPQRRGEMVRVLQELLERRGSKKRQRRNADQAIEFFYELENRALWNFEQPSEPPPTGLRELCKAP